MKLETIATADLGRAEKVTVDADNTTILKGAGSKTAVVGRIEQIRREIAATTSDYDREKLQERLAKLAGGVAQISVGAATETEMKEKKARVEDALHATRAAIEEGNHPRRRRGAAPREPARSIRSRPKAMRPIGVQIIRRVLTMPARPSPTTPASRAPWWSRRSRTRRTTPTASTPRRKSTATSSTPASWTRPRSPAPPCRTPSASPACC